MEELLLSCRLSGLDKVDNPSGPLQTDLETWALLHCVPKS